MNATGDHVEKLREEAKNWIRNTADEKAIACGMGFSLKWAEEVCHWIESHCCLYQGSLAGEPLKLMPYQREFIMRLFGWVRWSDEWNAWIRRFTHGGLWCPKKCGKSPLAAAYNLYLLSADNEPGQNVYMMAHDGQQARIAQMHAVNMVRQSPLLKDDCKVNNTTLQIAHLPTNSVLQVVTGDDKRGADSKHGYNGSVTIDEMHVVNRQMMEAVGRAGISRKEPLQMSFSTAGTDPSSVGFERCKYGREVNSGERDDLHFLHVEYAAPAGTTPAAIDERADELGQLANPAWGFIVKPSEFRADWQSSKSQPRKVATFLQERLNVWVGSTNPWLDTAGWEKGRRSFTLADLAGRDCYAALDLSRTRDLTAFVLLFPWPDDGDPEAVRVWPMFWTPEETARERDHLFPFKSWVTAGYITLTKGSVVDYNEVKADIRETITGNRLNVLNLRYDEHYANELTQALHEGEQVGNEKVDGVVAIREAFGQSLMYFTGPCKEFERRVSAGKIEHPGNAVLSWQVGHCEVWNDRNQNIRPVKPDAKSGKTVDGVVCCCMGMSCIQAIPEDTSFVYNVREPMIM